MAKRTSSISKKLRFEVFKRDGFQCGYCGKSPPEVTLEVDHINPKSLGGADDINNLLTACFDCNRGKAAIPIDKAPPVLSENLEVLREREDQLAAYEALTKKIERRIKRQVAEVAELWADANSGWELSRTGKRSIRTFLKSLPLSEVKEAMEIGCDRQQGTDGFKYFCGVCWKKIKHPGEFGVES